MIRPLFRLAVALLLLATPGYTRPDDRNAKARALLNELAAATRARTALSAAIEIRFRPNEQAPVQRSAGTFLAQRPGFCRVELHDGPFAGLIVSDGKTVLEAKTVKKYYRQYPIGSRGPTFYTAGLLPVAYFFSQRPCEEGTRREAAESARYLGTEVVNGEKTDVVETRTDTPQPNRVRLYIGPDKLLRRVVWSVVGNNSTAIYNTTLTKMQTDRRQAAIAFTVAPPPGLTPIETPDPAAALLSVGMTAPDFTLPTVGGGTFHLADALKRGKATMLNFWYVGCAPCEREFPELQRLYDALKGQGLNFLTVNSGDRDPAIINYLREHKLTLPTARGDDGENGVFVKYHVEAFPTTYVLDPNGKIVFRAVSYDEDGLHDALTGLGFRVPED